MGVFNPCNSRQVSFSFVAPLGVPVRVRVLMYAFSLVSGGVALFVC